MDLDPNVNESRLEEAGEITEEDMAIFDMAPNASGESDEPGQGDSDQSEDGDEDSPEVPSDEESEDDDADDSEDDEESEEDEDPDADEDEDGEGEDSDDEQEDGGEDSPAADESEDDGDDDPVDEQVSVEVAKSFEQEREETRKRFDEAHKNALNAMAEPYVPHYTAAQEAVKAARAELKALEEYYTTEDEDGYIPTMDWKANQKVRELERVVDKGEARIEQIRAELTKAKESIDQRFAKEKASAEQEVMIKANLKAYPALARVEEGFRELLKRGIPVTSVAEAVEVSGALMRAQGKKVSKGKAAPKPGEIEKAALESSIARKKSAAITAGRGASGSKGAGAKQNPYKGIPKEHVSVLKVYDNLFEEA